MNFTSWLIAVIILQDSPVVKQLPTGRQPRISASLRTWPPAQPTFLRHRLSDWVPARTGPTRFVENTFSWTDAVSWTRGKHNWKFGAGFSPYQENLLYDYYTNGEFDFYSLAVPRQRCTGNPYADFLLGRRVWLFPGTACRFQYSQQKHLRIWPGRVAHTQEPGANDGPAVRVQHAQVRHRGPQRFR